MRNLSTSSVVLFGTTTKQGFLLDTITERHSIIKLERIFQSFDYQLF
jgi:hypothetical protein